MDPSYETICNLNPDTGTKRRLLVKNPFNKYFGIKAIRSHNNKPHSITESGSDADNEQENSHSCYVSHEASPKSSIKTQKKKGVCKPSTSSTPGRRIGDYNHIVHLQNQATPTPPMHVTRSAPWVAMEEPYRQCCPPRGHLMQSHLFDGAAVLDTKVSESGRGDGNRGWVKVQDHAPFHECNQTAGGNPNRLHSDQARAKNYFSQPAEMPARDDVSFSSSCRTADLSQPKLRSGGKGLTQKNDSYSHFGHILDKRSTMGARALSPLVPFAARTDFPRTHAQPLLLCRPQLSRQKPTKPGHHMTSNCVQLSRDVKPAGLSQHPESARGYSQCIQSNESISQRSSLPSSSHAVSHDPRPGSNFQDTMAMSWEGRREDHTHQNIHGNVLLSSGGCERDTVTSSSVIKVSSFFRCDFHVHINFFTGINNYQ